MSFDVGNHAIRKIGFEEGGRRFDLVVTVASNSEAIDVSVTLWERSGDKSKRINRLSRGWDTARNVDEHVDERIL